MPQVALFILFVAIRIIVEVCKKFPQAPTRRYSTRYQRVESEPQHRSRASVSVGKKQNATLENVAKRLKGNVDYTSANPSISFRRNGTVFRAFVTNQHGVNSIRLLTHWPEDGFRLRIFPDQRRTRHWKQARQMEDITVGNDRFDESFIVQGNNAKSIKELLNDKNCKRNRSHVKNAHGRISITISGGEVEFGGKATRLLSKRQILAIIKSFADIHRLMLNSLAGVEIEGTQLVFVENRESKCMVCGVSVGVEQSVSCEDCQTRHHLDCWNYVGKCSTYGCHSRRAL